MNRLVIYDIVTLLARRADIEPHEADGFVRAFFVAAADAITANGTLTVKGLGTFVVSGDDVKYVPDATLAETINAPFALFEAVELPDDAPIDEPEPKPQPELKPELEPNSEPEPEPVTRPIGDSGQSFMTDPSPATEPAREPEPETLQEPAQEPAQEPVQEPESEALQEPAQEPEPEAVQEPIQESEPYVVADAHHSPIWRWILVIIVVAAAYAVGLFTPAIARWVEAISRPVPTDTVRVQVVEPVAVMPASDTDAIAAPKPPKEHLDTVRVKYYITHMAKRYYGDDNFWSYIYKENEAILGNPDLTQPGTVVVIPPAEKYHIDANNPTSLQVAKQLGYEIYQKYR